MSEECVLIVDEDGETAAALRAILGEAGVTVESADDTFAAMEKLREGDYCAVIIDPAIHHHLNGFAVLNFLELEQPQTLDNVYLLTGMSEQTIRRTAPSVLPRLFRKPSALQKIAAAVTDVCLQHAHDAGGAKQKRVLLAEDDRVTAIVTMSALEDYGYAVEWVQNGSDALDALSAGSFDAIVLDLVMPHVDGFAVLDHFRTHDAARLRKVIVTTGMPDKFTATLDASALGGIMQKPLDAGRLKDLLERVIQRPHCRFAAVEPGGELSA